jgi:tetratricopeptide (TPR) repeat protein
MDDASLPDVGTAYATPSDTDAERLAKLDRRLAELGRGVGALRLRIGEGLEAFAQRGGVAAFGFSSLGAYALQRLGRSQISPGGDNTCAHETFMRAVEVAEHLHGSNAPELVEVLLYATTGAPPEVEIALAERAVRITEAAHGPKSAKLGRPLACLAEALGEADRIDEAIAAAERAMAVTDEETRGGGMLAMLIGSLYATAQRFDDAIRMRIDAINSADSDPERHVARGYLAETLHAAGRFEESLTAIDEAIALHGEGGWYAALRALALDGLGRDELASAAAQRAIDLAREERGEAFAQKIAARVGDIASRRKGV